MLQIEMAFTEENNKHQAVKHTLPLSLQFLDGVGSNAEANYFFGFRLFRRHSNAVDYSTTSSEIED